MHLIQVSDELKRLRSLQKQLALQQDQWIQSYQKDWLKQITRMWEQLSGNTVSREFERSAPEEGSKKKPGMIDCGEEGGDIAREDLIKELKVSYI